MFSILAKAISFSNKQSVRSISFITSNHAPLMPSNRNGLSSSLLASSSSPVSNSQTYTSNIINTQLSPLANFLQLRWGTRGGNRGNTYQPNTLKRKRRLGFLSRMKSRTGRQIVKRRTDKGRWFLTH